jgi:enolase
MVKIKAIHAREILDSRGNPTIETTIWSEAGHATIASVPSGASTGKFEAHELRDNDQSRYRGQGVLKAVSNVNSVIAPRIVGMDPTYQTPIDKLLVEILPKNTNW